MSAQPSPSQAHLRGVLMRLAHLSDEHRYLHRLHCVLLVQCGCGCMQVAQWFGDSQRSVERWVRLYGQQGLPALKDHHAGGRPARLSAELRALLGGDMSIAPSALGYLGATWTGSLLAEHLARHLGVALSARQCQRLLRQERAQSTAASAAVPGNTSIRP